MDTQIDIILQGGQFKKLLEEQSVELREKYDMKRAGTGDIILPVKMRNT